MASRIKDEAPFHGLPGKGLIAQAPQPISRLRCPPSCSIGPPKDGSACPFFSSLLHMCRYKMCVGGVLL